jgi:hypothetical protein
MRRFPDLFRLYMATFSDAMRHDGERQSVVIDRVVRCFKDLDLKRVEDSMVQEVRAFLAHPLGMK